MRKTFLIAISIFFISSCGDSESQTDINNKFSIDIPKGWAVENAGNKHLSVMRFTDTTKEFPNNILFDISWESDKKEFTEEFKGTMDSIVLSKGWNPKNHSVQDINGFNAYYYDVIAKDSLGKFDFALDNRYLTKPKKEGTIFFTITRWQKELNKSDSIMVEDIFKSLEWK